MSHAFNMLAGTLLALGSLPTVPTVEVHSTRDPVDKSYRKMLDGIARFDRDRALAPKASLRFRLLPRHPGIVLDNVTLKVVGDTVSFPVPLGDDFSFTLQRNEQALREDAALVANRKASSMTWRADVRSPGVPPGMRRLGDLRLECLVGMQAGLVSNNSRLFAWLGALLNTPERVCGSADGNYLFFSERPVFAVQLQAGAMSATLPGRYLYAGGGTPPAELPFCDCEALLDRSYFAPIWDRSWPDDTLLAFEAMDDAVPPGTHAAPAISAGMARDEVREKLGDATEVRFLNGMSSWLYTQHWVLFDAAGRVLKSRTVP